MSRRSRILLVVVAAAVVASGAAVLLRHEDSQTRSETFTADGVESTSATVAPTLAPTTTIAPASAGPQDWATPCTRASGTEGMTRTTTISTWSTTPTRGSS